MPGVTIIRKIDREVLAARIAKEQERKQLARQEQANEELHGNYGKRQQEALKRFKNKALAYLKAARPDRQTQKTNDIPIEVIVQEKLNAKIGDVAKAQ